MKYGTVRYGTVQYGLLYTDCVWIPHTCTVRYSESDRITKAEEGYSEKSA